MTKRGPADTCHLVILSFEFVSDFVLRISCFSRRKSGTSSLGARRIKKLPDRRRPRGAKDSVSVPGAIGRVAKRDVGEPARFEASRRHPCRRVNASWSAEMPRGHPRCGPTTWFSVRSSACALGYVPCTIAVRTAILAAPAPRSPIRGGENTENRRRASMPFSPHGRSRAIVLRCGRRSLLVDWTERFLGTSVPAPANRAWRTPGCHHTPARPPAGQLFFIILREFSSGSVGQSRHGYSESAPDLRSMSAAPRVLPDPRDGDWLIGSMGGFCDEN